MNTTKIFYGLYDDDDVLLTAIKAIKNKGIDIANVYTPFPVHGLDKVLGLQKTRISDMGFIYGIYGLTLAITLTWFTMIKDWPMNIGGKPSFSWIENMPAFVPVIFELTVFSAAHLMCLTFFLRNSLYPGRAPHNPDPRTTDDMFMIEIHGGRNDEIKNIFIETGAVEVSLKEI